MTRPTDYLVRAHPRLTCRDDDLADDALLRMDITFARFNQWNEIDSYWEGRFLERVAPGAFIKTFSERRDQITSLFNHGHDPVIGDKKLGPVVEVGERDGGPFMVVELLDTSYGRDLEPAIRRGLYGASYMFRVIAEDWNDAPDASDSNPLGLPERTIREVKLYEAGPVTFPADESTSIKLRSMSDRFSPLAPRHQSRQADPLGGRAEDEAAAPHHSEPVHHSGLTVAQARVRLASLNL